MYKTCSAWNTLQMYGITLSIKAYMCLKESSETFYEAYPSLANLSYPMSLYSGTIDLEPLELRRLKSGLVIYYTILSLYIALSILQCQMSPRMQTRTGGNRLLRPLCSTKLYENDFFNRCVYILLEFCTTYSC